MVCDHMIPLRDLCGCGWSTGRYFATSQHLIGFTDMGELMSGVFVMFGAAGMAFMLGVSEYWLVYHTSSLTLVISGVFKVSSSCHVLGIE